MGLFEHKADADTETGVKHESENEESDKEEVNRAHKLWI